MTKLIILGSTGSIGQQTLEVVAAHPDKLRVLGIAARNRRMLADQARRFAVPLVGVATDTATDTDRDAGDGMPEGTRVLRGRESLVKLATHPDADIVVVATVGRAGLEATLAAVRAGKKVAIANKEALVMAGALITEAAKEHGATLLPIDSEHSALWQCLMGEDPESVAELLLTASGGALRDYDPAQLDAITPEQALRHPTWVMGPKVTIDSATLMNKGLEVMEARWLFDVPLERIAVVMHPTSTVHSLVRFRDGALKAQLGSPDMKAPIQFALSYPQRWPIQTHELDITQAGPLTFGAPPAGRYPCLELALRAGRQGGTYPAALCAADEVAVELFLERRIPFTAIPRLIAGVLDAHQPSDDHDLAAILHADTWARAECLRLAALFPPTTHIR
jgi:1-deoxy-D-xylulose-5-phosphate reductoisomerase